MASSFASTASTTPSAIIAPNHIHKCSPSSSMLSFHLPHKIKTTLPLLTKGSPTTRMLLPRVKVQPDDISIFHWPSVENALSNALHHLLNNDDAKKISSEGVLATEESISSFITHVASLVRLVDSRDIVELQLKKLDCEIIIRKKEATSQPQAPTEVVMLNSPLPSPPVVG
ncbi:hypothetical protein PIB30_053211 [Stylosanthes scabra]|uniref:Uncharacterized protein n=1 Tax=Stylosanthes scabra TaxID=79078 RepID=A0ABU6RIZ0_9FABA|nr:hypothetical protein [Stylosanthes scabra]